MRLVLRPLVIGAIGLMSAPNASADELVVVCPPNIAGENLRVLHAPQGWSSAVTETGVVLNGASLMSGPPADRATLLPTTKGASNEDVWTDMRPIPEGWWMACSYGANQEFTLSRRLPDDTKECRIRYTRDKLKRLQLNIRCKS